MNFTLFPLNLHTSTAHRDPLEQGTYSSHQLIAGQCLKTLSHDVELGGDLPVVSDKDIWLFINKTITASLSRSFFRISLKTDVCSLYAVVLALSRVGAETKLVKDG